MTPVRTRVIERARTLGFDAVGIARADEPLGVEFERYRAFVDAGRHGVMGYLAEEPEARRRLDSESILPGAKSVICLARRYARSPAEEADDPPLAQRVARYARGQDYHNFLRKKVRQLAAFVRTLGEGVRARPLCDEESILERAWAARAGLGFIGKNGLVIVPGQGSYVLLGEVVTTLALEPDVPMSERCGSCTRCLDACPTAAFAAPFVLDPRRCVAYLTIEDTAGDRVGVTEHLFGCDACQSVCPFNKTAPGRPEKTRPFRPLPAWDGLGLADLLRLDEAAFLALTTGSPLRRATRSGLARSAARLAVAEAKAGRVTRDVVEALTAASEHDDDVVRSIAEEAPRPLTR